MPYTKEELEDVDFYKEFIDTPKIKYLDRLAKSALNFFRKSNAALVSFEDIDTGLGIENASFTSDTYGVLDTALTSNGVEYYAFRDILEDPGAAAAYEASLAGASATNPPEFPPEPSTSDIFEYIRSLSNTKTNKKYPKNIKNSTLDKVLDRSISELSTEKYAETLPDGIINGDVITNEFAGDQRKWLIENNQKRIYPNIESFYASGIPFNKIKLLNMTQLNTLPDGEPAE
tara:strand:+ start:516 stop:1208 length:693 start_codon:yes stop_codon:yes gene_type:complete